GAGSARQGVTDGVGPVRTCMPARPPGLHAVPGGRAGTSL
ncbi:MAG: hypothetical protein AVDCRST_MAG29-2497, partial [uncultured Nocardioidaceae bacterium]